MAPTASIFVHSMSMMPKLRKGHLDTLHKLNPLQTGSSSEAVGRDGRTGSAIALSDVWRRPRFLRGFDGAPIITQF